MSAVAGFFRAAICDAEGRAGIYEAQGRPGIYDEGWNGFSG
jgi:hypothetical protein